MRHLAMVLVSLAVFGLADPNSHAQDKDKGKGKEKKKETIELASASCKHLDGQRIVFAINDWKGWTNCAEGLQETNSDWNLGLVIVPINWSRYDHRFEDLRDNDAQLNAAFRVASMIKAIRKDAPNAQIFIVGHGCGARIALVAAEMSAPKSIDRIILQHANVANFYDVRGALKASRHGIDNLYSDMDNILDATSAHSGNADGMRGIPAGISGFRCTDPKEAEAYRGLRQIKWGLEHCGSGGHCTWTMHHNVKRVIVPMINHTPHGDVAVVVPPPKKIEKKEKEKGKMPEAD